MRYVALVLAGALLFLACGGDGGGDGVGNPDPSATVQGGPPALPSGLEATTTPSELQIFDIVVGDGATPEVGDSVLLRFDAWLEDGTRFDTSQSLSGPFESEFGTGILIDGLDEGIKEMQVGGMRRLIIPPELAYGEEGRPPTIPANATLTFDIELVGVMGADEAE